MKHEISMAFVTKRSATPESALTLAEALVREARFVCEREGGQLISINVSKCWDQPSAPVGTATLEAAEGTPDAAEDEIPF